MLWQVSNDNNNKKIPPFHRGTSQHVQAITSSLLKFRRRRRLITCWKYMVVRNNVVIFGSQIWSIKRVIEQTESFSNDEFSYATKGSTRSVRWFSAVSVSCVDCEFWDVLHCSYTMRRLWTVFIYDAFKSSFGFIGSLSHWTMRPWCISDRYFFTFLIVNPLRNSAVGKRMFAHLCRKMWKKGEHRYDGRIW